MQIWPDADFAVAHKHGVTAYGVTAFEPNDPLERVLEQLKRAGRPIVLLINQVVFVVPIPCGRSGS